MQRWGTQAERQRQPWLWGASIAVRAASAGCVDIVDADRDELPSRLAGSLAPAAEFDPAQRIVPLPNALSMDPETGRVNVPPSCGEEPGSPAARLREALNELDGFATSRARLTATFTEPVDPESLAGRVFVVRLAERGMPLPAFEGPVPFDGVPGSSERFAPDCTSSERVPNLTLLPRAPLLGSSTYGVLLLRGIRAASAREFEPSPTWALVRQADAPVRFAESGGSPLPEQNLTPFDPAEPEGLASLQGLDRLWRAHAPLLSALDQLGPALTGGAALEREDVLLAWAFDTQTLGDPLDPELPGSPANQLYADPGPLVLPSALAGAGAPLSIEAYFAGALPGVPCSRLGCDAIGAIHAGSAVSEAPRFTSVSFLEGDDCTLPGALAGAFSDPVAPARVCERPLPLLAVLPQAPPGPRGYPTVMFAHALGRSKEDLLALAGTLAQGGIASVAFDAVDHGARAVQVSTDPALGCDGAGAGRPCAERFGPTCAPQCFAPLLSADLPRTRDHLRQTMLDQLRLLAVLRGCAAAGACGALPVDEQRIGYLGQSLGSWIGGVSVAMSPALRTAVLNAGAADWLQLLTESRSPELRCPFVDALIGAGLVTGELWNRGANPAAACLGEEWRTEPRFLEFAAAARWLLDPADPVNYAARLGSERNVLLAEIAGDAVVPSSATLALGSALGLEPEAAAVADSLPLEPSPAVLLPGSHWVRYPGVEADPARGFPGNAYGHGSLLAPAAPSAGMGPGSGELGTLRLQVDTRAYFQSHLGGAE